MFQPVIAMFGLGPTELAILGVIGVLLFGSRLPKLAYDFGRSFTQFKKGISGVEDAVAEVKSAGQGVANDIHTQAMMAQRQLDMAANQAAYVASRPVSTNDPGRPQGHS